MTGTIRGLYDKWNFAVESRTNTIMCNESKTSKNVLNVAVFASTVLIKQLGLSSKTTAISISLSCRK